MNQPMSLLFCFSHFFSDNSENVVASFSRKTDAVVPLNKTKWLFFWPRKPARHLGPFIFFSMTVPSFRAPAFRASQSSPAWCRQNWPAPTKINWEKSVGDLSVSKFTGLCSVSNFLETDDEGLWPNWWKSPVTDRWTSLLSHFDIWTFDFVKLIYKLLLSGGFSPSR